MTNDKSFYGNMNIYKGERVEDSYQADQWCILVSPVALTNH